MFLYTSTINTFSEELTHFMQALRCRKHELHIRQILNKILTSIALKRTEINTDIPKIVLPLSVKKCTHL